MLPTGIVVVALVAAHQSRSFIDRVPELQRTAVVAAGGGLGCGVGVQKVDTSRGVVKVATSLDPIHVFGHTVEAAELLTLLKSRADSNRTGKPGPMSGQVARLCALCMGVLAASKEPDAVPVLAELLADSDDTVRGVAAFALFRLGDLDEELRPAIRKVNFPDAAIKSAAAHSARPPTWLGSGK